VAVMDPPDRSSADTVVHFALRALNCSFAGVALYTARAADRDSRGHRSVVAETDSSSRARTVR
jgi:hypothetical protein